MDDAMIAYEPFVPIRDIPLKPKMSLRIAADKMICITRQTADRIGSMTSMSMAELLNQLRAVGVPMAGIDQDTTLHAASKALLEDGVDREQLDCMMIADIAAEVERRQLDLHTSNYDLEFYAMWSVEDEREFIAILRRNRNGSAILFDLTPRIKPQGAPWDWHGAVPPASAFRESRKFAGLPVDEEEDDVIAVYTPRVKNPQWTHRYVAIWREPSDGSIQTQEISRIPLGEDPLASLPDALDLARGDSPTMGCTLALKNRNCEVLKCWEIDPWVRSGYISDVREVLA